MRSGLMQKYLYILFIFMLWACEEAIQQETSETETSVGEKSDVTIDLMALDGLFTVDTITVEIENDQVFKKNKKYLAYPLQPILEQTIRDHNIDILSTEIIFACTDGYRPSNRLQDVMDHGKGFLAFRDLEAPEGQSWSGEESEKYAPFILVWKNLSADDKKLAWPYGLYSLSLVSSDAIFASIYPADNSALEPAFDLFKQNCMKCHSINKIGGIMGPEFNYPTNITSYWKRENIVAFAKNPQSFRYNSKMPPVTNLSDEELNLIIDYLVYVSNVALTEN